MTQAEFDARFRAPPEKYPNLSHDTLLRLNREVFALVADLDAALAAQAVNEAFHQVEQEL